MYLGGVVGCPCIVSHYTDVVFFFCLLKSINPPRFLFSLARSTIPSLHDRRYFFAFFRTAKANAKHARSARHAPLTFVLLKYEKK